MIWLIFVIVAIVGYFLFAIYTHDDSIFTKKTGYSYVDTLLNKQAKTTKQLYDTLVLPNTDNYLLTNVQLPEGTTTRKLDAVFIHESGIYALKAEYKNGWIVGREFDAEWFNLLHKGKKETFDNPVNEAKRAVFAMRGILPELSAETFNPMVIFSNDCSFQKIELESNHIDVMKANELKKWRQTLAGQRLTASEMATAYAALQEYEVKRETQPVQTPLTT